jgi:DNA-binding NtrC family response regulator
MVAKRANMRTVLLIDGDGTHVEAFRDALLTATDGPFRGEWVKTLAEGTALLRAKEIWAIFVNLRLPDSRGLKILEELALAASGVPTLVLAGAKQTKRFLV